MSGASIGGHAVVVGASIAGMAAAAAIAPHFQKVTVLERDTIPAESGRRRGVPQGGHLHGLLAGGHRALASLIPGFDDALTRAGAVSMIASRDPLIERAPFDPFPRRNFDLTLRSASRPLIEHVIRTEVLRTIPNVSLEIDATVQSIAVTDRRASGVVYRCGDGRTETLGSDLVIDASGRGELTLSLLDRLELPRPGVTSIGVDIAYSSSIFQRPEPRQENWLGCQTFSSAPTNSRSAALIPIENNRWILTAAAHADDHPPAEPAALMQYLAGMRTDTIARALSNATRLTGIAQYRFPESFRRHYERLAGFPDGVLVLGDAMARINPIYGQGMTVAAQEAAELRQLLDSRAGMDTPLQGFAGLFFRRMASILDTPWRMSAVSDLSFPFVRGERPPNFKSMVATAAAIESLAAEDPEVHRLQVEVAHLLKPSSQYFEGPLGKRILHHVQEAQRHAGLA